MPNNVILLVEDNEDDAYLALRAFRKSKVQNEIVRVSDGVEALDYLFYKGAHANRPPGLPEVVLLDLNMPRMDGLEVLRRLRADPATKTLPVVVLTSSSEDQDVLRSYDLGANSYVRKPVNFERFVEAASQLGLYWLVLNQSPPDAGGPRRD
jgi:two-component system, response regulator